jgi:hypothetical protein
MRSRFELLSAVISHYQELTPLQRDFRLFPCGEQRLSGKAGVNWQKQRKRCLSTVREGGKSP